MNTYKVLLYDPTEAGVANNIVLIEAENRDKVNTMCLLLKVRVQTITDVTSVYKEGHIKLL